MPRRMTKWRVLSPSAQLIIEPASGARAIISDTCADGAYRFHWSVIPSEESLPIAAGRTGGLGRARSIAEEALRAYAADFRMHAEMTGAANPPTPAPRRLPVFRVREDEPAPRCEDAEFLNFRLVAGL